MTNNKQTILRTVKFSLIEILVVVAIIGILASFLMPVLSKARKQSRIVVCLSQQKQLGTAIFMYAGDNNDYVPQSSTKTWDDRLGGGYDGRNLTENQMDGVWPTTSELYVCPLDETPSGRHPRSYSMTQAGPGSQLGMTNGDEDVVRRLVEINNPTETIMLLDYPAPANDLGTPNRHVRKTSHVTNPDGGDSFWSHGWGEMNYLMTDGSAKGLSLTQTFLGQRYPWDNSNPSDTMWDSHR
ncbi:hypothetical protein LNTAR_17488 [Lentisphaera araneosa HTCC2155]|uniref:General secretion pathway protein G n=1 Tax=Lentisphaera araneosa HTCC2155 TaxID=313628 RepID=A6DFI6_9BACT|nr:type II secretion system protein [Lentisphaera araneosa]EDM29566.1 hypothetical protein LNTAR_17488 [Lentisphaera araneosa HTCC2155]